jgi:hypothetical protein
VGQLVPTSTNALLLQEEPKKKEVHAIQLYMTEAARAFVEGVIKALRGNQVNFALLFMPIFFHCQ